MTAGANGKQRHVFVVNDAPEVLALFQELLGEDGFRVSIDTFRHGSLQLAHDAIRAAEPDLVILDYLIGDEDLGWQLLQMLKMDRATRELPVIICSAAVKTIEQLRAHLQEMHVGVVLKPFDIDVLLSEVARLLDSATVDTKDTDLAL